MKLQFLKEILYVSKYQNFICDNFSLTLSILYAQIIILFSQWLGFVCLFELMLDVQVNNYGHVGTLPPFYARKLGRQDVQKVLKIRGAFGKFETLPYHSHNIHSKTT